METAHRPVIVDSDSASDSGSAADAPAPRPYYTIVVDQRSGWGPWHAVVDPMLADAAAGAARTVAVDAEWHGQELCLVQVAVELGAGADVPIAVFVVDCVVLGAAELQEHLAPLLEAGGVRKLFFDCRKDCAVIGRHCDLRIRACFDLQLLEVLTRPQAGASKVVNVFGLKRCLEEFDSLLPFRAAKANQNLRPQGSSIVFTERPLAQDVLDYAVADVAALFTLEEALLRRPGSAHPTLLARQVRDATRVYQELGFVVPEGYTRHSMLPLGVLPVAPAVGAGLCDSCRRHVAATSRKQCTVCFLSDSSTRRKKK